MNIKNIYWVFLFLLLSFSFASCGGDDDNESLSGGGITDLSRNREAVDLGLSVKWANMNIGANSETDYGTYFAWGETTGYTVIGATNVGASGNIKTEFSWATYKWCEGTNKTLTKYNNDKSSGIVDNKYKLDPEDDAATVNWGSNWRMPTYKECQELIENTTRTWEVNYKGSGCNGYLFTSKKPGYTDKSIFLPAAGEIRHSEHNSGFLHQGVRYQYWTSELYGFSEAYCFSWGDVYTSKYRGYTIRPVQ